jgi:hypothetical protein
MPAIVLDRAELMACAGETEPVREATTARIDWEPNTGQVELSLYDAAGALVGRQTITAAAGEARR